MSTSEVRDNPADLVSPDREPAAENEAAESPSHERSRNPSSLQHWIFFVFSLLIITLAFVLNVPGKERVFLPVFDNVALPGLCTTRTVLGIPCPGCGLTRCFICLAHGEFGRAWHFNPAGLLLFGFVLFQIPFQFTQLWRIRSGSDIIRVGKVEWFCYVLVTLLLTQWVVKLVSQSF